MFGISKKYIRCVLCSCYPLVSSKHAWKTEVNGGFKRKITASMVHFPASRMFEITIFKVNTQYPLVNQTKTMENHGKSPFLMGKSHEISMAMAAMRRRHQRSAALLAPKVLGHSPGPRGSRGSRRFCGGRAEGGGGGAEDSMGC